MEDKPLSIINLNINTAFKVTWTDIIKMRKLIYIVVEAKKARFVEISLTRLNISFTKEDQYVIL